MVKAEKCTMKAWWSTTTMTNSKQPDIVRIAKEGLQMLQELRKLLKNGEVALVAQNNGRADSIEICILYPAGHEPAADLAIQIEVIATNFKHECRNYTTSGNGFDFNLNDGMAATVNKLQDLTDTSKITPERFAELIKKIIAAQADPVTTKWNASAPFFLSKGYVRELDKQNHEGMGSVIDDIVHRLDKVKDLPTSMRIMYCYAHGIMAVPPAYGLIKGQDSEMAIFTSIYLIIGGFCLIGMSGGAAAVAGLALGALGVLLLMMTRSERSVLLIANSSQADISLIDEKVLTGKRTKLTAFYPGWTLDNEWASAGFSVYDKRDNEPRGNCFGLAFDCKLGQFSIGMETPSIWQRNCVEAIPGNNAQGAAKAAYENAWDKRWSDGPPKVDIKMVGFKGNVNKAVALITAKP